MERPGKQGQFKLSLVLDGAMKATIVFFIKLHKILFKKYDYVGMRTVGDWPEDVRLGEDSFFFF